MRCTLKEAMNVCILTVLTGPPSPQFVYQLFQDQVQHFALQAWNIFHIKMDLNFLSEKAKADITGTVII